MTEIFFIRVAAATGVYLVVLIVCIAMLLRSQQRTQAYRDRVAAVTARQTRMAATGGGTMAMTSAPLRSRRFVNWLTKSPRRRPEQIQKMWIILAIGLGLAAGAAKFLVAFLGYAALPILLIFPVMLTRYVFDSGDRRLTNAYRRQFPEALNIIARTVRVGVPVGEALRIVARECQNPTAREFAYMVNRITIGIPLGEALHSSADRTGLTEHRLFANAVSLQTQTGGGLTETLMGLSATVRKRTAARDRALAMVSEARMTSYILGGLPVVTGGLLAVVNPSYISVLFTDHSGNIILLAAISSLMTGMFIMRLIIRRNLS